MAGRASGLQKILHQATSTPVVLCEAFRRPDLIWKNKPLAKVVEVSNSSSRKLLVSLESFRGKIRSCLGITRVQPTGDFLLW